MTAGAAAVPVAPAGGTPRLSRGRRGAIWGLIVLASLIGVLSILATWVNRQVISDKSWKTTSAKLIEDPEIRSALSVYLVNSLYDNVDVAGALAQRLPSNLAPLAAPVSAALRQPATQGVDFLLARPRVQASFVDASSLAHQKLINVLENKTGVGIETGNGAVTVDLSALVKEVGTQLGLPAAALDKLPPNTGVITIMRSDQLSAAQAGFRAIKILSVWLLVLTLVLFGVAIWLAKGIRRETLRNVGWAFIFIGLLTVVARNQLGSYTVGSLTNPPFDKPAHRVWVIGTSTLGEIGWAVVFYGVIGVLGAVLAGPTRAATAVRGWIAPTLNYRPGVAWATVGFVFVLLIWWGGTHALRTVWGVLVLGGLLAIGVLAFRRETLAEFPDATPGGGAVASVSAAAGKVAAARKPAAPPERTTAQELAHLKELRDSGALTDEEYARAKERALT